MKLRWLEDGEVMMAVVSGRRMAEEKLTNYAKSRKTKKKLRRKSREVFIIWLYWA